MRPALIQGDNWNQTVPVKEWYSIQDVCTILDVGGPSAYGAIQRGTLKGYLVNGVKMVKHDDLIDYIARRAAVPTYDPTKLDVVAIVPTKTAGKSAESLAAAVTADAVDEDELAFLDEK